MVKIGKGFLLLSIFMMFCFSTVIFAKDSIRVEAKVNRSTVAVGQTINLILQVVSEEAVRIEDPRLPDLSDFEVVGSWNSQSTSSRLVQGARGMEFQTRRMVEYTYQIIPRSSGAKTLSSFQVVVEGQEYQTRPIQIEVTLDPSQMPDPFDQSDIPDTDDVEAMFNQMLQRRRVIPQPNVVPRNPNEAFFIHLDIDKKEAYVGEQITVSWYLYTRGQILGLDRLKFPDLKGFWKEIIEEVPALNFKPEVLNGVMYRKALLASHALFPIREGVSVVDEYKVKATVQLPSGAFGGLVYGEPYSYQRSSDRVEIKVKELPKAGQPSNFSGAVGSFNVTASIGDPRVPLNQPFALKLRFEGQGNAKLIDLPEISWPQGVEYFDQKSEARFFKNGRSFREFEVLLIPRQPGEMVIPPVEFAFFDPANGQYYSRQTQAVKIFVDGQLAVDSSAEAALNPPEGGGKIKPTPALPALKAELSESQHNRQDVWTILSLISILLSLGFLGYTSYREFFGYTKKQTWREYFDERQKKIKRLSSKENPSEIAALMSETLSKLIGGASLEGNPSKEFRALLRQAPPSLQAQIGEDILKYFEELQRVAYAPYELSKEREKWAELEKAFPKWGHQVISYMEFEG